MAILAVVRRTWRQLTSMRTALILLFLLALAAVPGSLLPQRPLNPAKVQSYLQTHGSWGRVLDRIGAFDVFGSIWFTAVYLLLFVSLVGCLTPRIAVYAKALRAKPMKAPRNLARLAENTSFASALSAPEAAAGARTVLRPRWRTTVRHESETVTAVSAEKGYSREAGNLIFHISLLIALVLIAIGRFYSYQITNVVTEGDTFCNTTADLDSFHGGSRVNPARLPGFCVTLDQFHAAYRADGTPSQFNADVHYQHSTDSPELADVIRVNHPLRLAGDRVYLLNHGFSPIVTIQRPGKPAVSFPQAFLPQNGLLLSEGAFQDRNDGTNIGLSAIFAPTANVTDGVLTSTNPQPNNPMLAVIAYEGQLDPPDDPPQSVYSLNQSQIASGALAQVAAANLSIGQSMTLPDRTVVTFTGYKQWASLQVSHDPTQGLLLGAAVAMVLGLLGSLAVKRRRLWLRITAGPGGLTLVEVGGLARSDTGNFTEEFQALAERLRIALSAESDAGHQPVAELLGAGKD